MLNIFFVRIFKKIGFFDCKFKIALADDSATNQTDSIANETKTANDDNESTNQKTSDESTVKADSSSSFKSTGTKKVESQSEFDIQE